MIKYKLFFTPSTHNFAHHATWFIKLYQIQSFSPTSKSICVQCIFSVRLFFLGPVTQESQCVTPAVSNWQCSKWSPTSSAHITLFSCLMFCSSNVYQAQVLTCCPVPQSKMPVAPHSFRDKMMSSSRSELSELSVCAIDKCRFRSVGLQRLGAA